MVIDKVVLIYFSPTGGTLRAARIVAGEFRAPVEEIDITGPDATCSRALGPGELAVVAVPCYGGRVPEPAARRLTHFLGEGAPALPVVAFGGRAYGDALRELGDILTGMGFVPVAAAAVVAEHSLARGFASGRPDERDRAELRAFAIKARVKLGALADARDGRVRLGGDEPYRRVAPLPLRPLATDACVRCGSCARACPVGAIDAALPERADADLCISCQRCVAACPRGARALGRAAGLAVALQLKARCRRRARNVLLLGEEGSDGRV